MPDYKRTITIELGAEELADIIRQHLNVAADAKVNFKIREVSDYMDRYSHQEFTGVQVEYVESPNKAEKYERGF